MMKLLLDKAAMQICPIRCMLHVQNGCQKLKTARM